MVGLHNVATAQSTPKNTNPVFFGFFANNRLKYKRRQRSIVKSVSVSIYPTVTMFGT